MDVHWLGQTASDVPARNKWLGSGELAVLERLHVPKRRADWRLGRWTAKRAIAAWLGRPWVPQALAAIEVRPAASGAPEAFVDGHRAGFSLSLSHSDGVGFCALSGPGMEMGCDVERVAPHSPAFLADYFTEAERRLIAAGTERAAILPTLLWSAKESALKALGMGLRLDTRSVAVLPSGLARWRDGQWLAIAARHESGRSFFGWWRSAGGLVWTVLTTRPVLSPIALAA